MQSNARPAFGLCDAVINALQLSQSADANALQVDPKIESIGFDVCEIMFNEEDHTECACMHRFIRWDCWHGLRINIAIYSYASKSAHVGSASVPDGRISCGLCVRKKSIHLRCSYIE